MSELRRFLAEIGRKGGTKSRRVLDSQVARLMVARREARRAAQRAAAIPAPLPGTPGDTSASAQAIQDALWRRASASEKLMQVARLCRTVEQLSMAGLRQRHPADDAEALRSRRAELRLGKELVSRVHASNALPDTRPRVRRRR